MSSLQTTMLLALCFQVKPNVGDVGRCRACERRIWISWMIIIMWSWKCKEGAVQVKKELGILWNIIVDFGVDKYDFGSGFGHFGIPVDYSSSAAHSYFSLTLSPNKSNFGSRIEGVFIPSF